MNKFYFNKLSVFILIITAGLILTLAAARKRKMPTMPMPIPRRPIVDVATAQAIVQNIPTYFEATGTLASDAQTDVAPAVGGKIVQVNFDIGSYVQKGSVLVQLDDRDARINSNRRRRRFSRRNRTSIRRNRRSNRRKPMSVKCSRNSDCRTAELSNSIKSRKLKRQKPRLI